MNEQYTLTSTYFRYVFHLFYCKLSQYVSILFRLAIQTTMYQARAIRVFETGPRLLGVSKLFRLSQRVKFPLLRVSPCLFFFTFGFFFKRNNFFCSQCTTLSSANTNFVMFGTCLSADTCTANKGTVDGNCASGKAIGLARN